MEYRLVIYKYVTIANKNGKLKTMTKAYLDCFVREIDLEETIETIKNLLKNNYAGYIIKGQI